MSFRTESWIWLLTTIFMVSGCKSLDGGRSSAKGVEVSAGLINKNVQDLLGTYLVAARAGYDDQYLIHSEKIHLETIKGDAKHFNVVFEQITKILNTFLVGEEPASVDCKGCVYFKGQEGSVSFQKQDEEPYEYTIRVGIEEGGDHHEIVFSAKREKDDE